MAMSSVLERLTAGAPGLLVLLDPGRTDPPDAARVARAAEEAGAAGFLIGSSFDGAEHTGVVAAAIRKATGLPLLLFPGGAGQLTPLVDAVLFLSLVSGRNAQYLIEEHVRAVPFFARHPVEVISTAYILIDGGSITAVESVSQTRPLPADKPEIAAAHAVAAQMIGMRAVYLDAGSGAAHPVAPAVIRAVRRAVTLPLLVGGGMKTPEQVRAARMAGADLVVVGTAVETGGAERIHEFVAALA
jgi:phosphoglycerol geranylgeranyltransferase